jgi:RNA polymerase sigma-70 factor (ECF subfamily)
MLDKALADPTVVSNRYVGSSAYGALSDEQLLECFVRRREEAAFAALVRRYGSMVLGVCRRILRHSHDAEDAFQATFLVLANKAQRLKNPELLANWLYGVAYRTALHARNRSARRSRREREAVAISVPSSDSDSSAQELSLILDEELRRLPEKYRAPLVLCYLQGKTNEEAARLLGWPTGSMSHRLARARELLRERLQPRLAALSSLLPAIFLADRLPAEVVSPLLAQTTMQAAATLVGVKMGVVGAGVLSASVRELMEATLRDLAPSWRRWLLGALLLALLLFGACAAIYAAGGAGPPGDAGCCHSAP